MSDYKRLSPSDGLFPDELTHVEPIPCRLFLKGDLNDSPKVAIVGSRKFTPYGKFAAEEVAKHLVHSGVIVVSGLALGIDSIAHQAALDTGGKTIAVLPCGIDQVYPAAHRQLAENILSSGGAIISEYPPGFKAQKHTFPERNRIVSGLSTAVVVIEAAHKSGSLITARLGMEQGKEVFALPGPINSTVSQGTNTLIKAGAHVITEPRDITDVLGIHPNEKEPIRREFGSDVEELIFKLLDEQGELDGDEIIKKLGIDSQQYNQAITMLEIRGYVIAQGGNRWQAK